MRLSYEALKKEISEHKGSFAVYMLLRAFVVLTLILQLLNGNFENVFLCLLTLLLLIVPAAIQVEFHIELPTLLEVILLVFIFCAEILGEINAFYERIPIWDTVLHTVNGFVAAAIGFSLVDLMNRNERIAFSLSPLFAVLVAFCVSMTIGVMWEFFEFFMDQVFQLDMQKDTVILGGYLDIGLIDTMQDLLVNFIGAVLFSFFGYFCMKYKDKRKLLRKLVPRRKEKN